MMSFYGNSKISQKIIYVLVPVFLILGAIIYFQFKSFSDKDLENQKVFAAKKNATQIQKLISDFESRGLTIANIFASNPDVIRAYKMDDELSGSDFLKSKINPILNQIKEENNLDVLKLHFHKVPGYSFLRVWKDKRFDDLRSFRSTILEVYNTGNSVKAIELGRGGFAIRGIAPIYDGDSLLGSVEMFYSPMDIAKLITEENSRIGIFFLVDKLEAEKLFMKEEIDKNFNIEVAGHLASDLSADWIEPKKMTNPEKISEVKETGEVINETNGNYAISYIPIKDFQGSTIGQTIFIKDFEQKISTTNKTIIMINVIIGIIIIVVFVIIVFVIKSTVTNPIGKINLALKQMSKGDVDFDSDMEMKTKIESFLNNKNEDEIGSLAKSFNATVLTIRELVNEVQSLTKEASEGNLSYRGDCDKFKGSFNKIVCGINTTVENIVVPMNTATSYMEKISKGDIPPKITDTYHGDFNEIKNNLNLCIDSINLLVKDANMLVDAAIAEKFETRADADNHNGDFRNIINGVNKTLDLVVDKVFWYEALLDAIQSPISVTDLDMNWTFINKAAENVTGLNRKDAKGQHCSNWNADICGTEKCGVAGLRKGKPTSYFTQPGLDMDFKVDTSYITNRQGEKIGHIEVVTDVTESTKKAKYNSNEIERLGKNLQIIASGSLDIDKNITEPDKFTEAEHSNFEKIYKNLNIVESAIQNLIDDANLLTSSAVEGKLDVRADISKHKGAFKEIISGVNNTLDNVIGPLNVAAEYIDRISKGDIPPKITDEYKGDFNEIKNNLNLAIDSINNMLNDVNILVDNMTHAKFRYRADENVHNGDFRKLMHGINNSIERIINVMDNVAAPIMGIDSEFNIVFMNKFGADLDNQTTDGILGKKCYNHFKTSHCNTGKCACYRAQDENLTVSAETDAHPGNLDLEIKYTGFPIKDDDGKIIGAFEIVMDQTEVKNTLKQVQLRSEYQGTQTNKIVDNLEKLSNGNFDVEFDIDSPDEETKNEYETIMQIVSSINKFIDSVENLQKDVKGITSAAVNGDLTARADTDKHNGEFRNIIDGLNQILDLIIEPINDAGEILEQVSKGDLTVLMQKEYKGDLQKLKNDINLLVSSFSELLVSVDENVHTTASSAAEISATSESLAASTEELSAQAEEVASAVEEMAKTVSDNAHSANRTAEVANDNRKAAGEGGEVVENTIRKMQDIANVVRESATNIQKLGDSSKKIGEIISVIDDIADQTNLLALNAAIEAARAGEQGRGFAVVADEVRKLAERTTEATKQIADMIKGIQSDTDAAVVAMNKGTNEVESGIELADKAGNSLKRILESTDEVVDMINQIAAASEEQSATSEEISKNVYSISKVTAESSKRVQDVSVTTEDLARLTEKLSELMSNFKIYAEENKQLGNKDKRYLSE